MSRIFISHSSKDNARAIQLRDWIVEEFGESEIFLDLDPRQGLAPGERWKEELKRAAHRCQVVLALISGNWLQSRYCQAELATATLLGKRVISVILDATPPAELPADLLDTQFVRLDDVDWKSHLREGLKRARLDPSAFSFDESRPPYPGLRALEEDDAAIFFGRDAEIVRAVDELRLMREKGLQRLLLIVGASGSGKSSFLRAGLWPRLRRDDANYFVLPVVRPDAAVLTGRSGLDGALERAFAEERVREGVAAAGLPTTRGAIAGALVDDVDSLAAFAGALAAAARIPLPGGEMGPRPGVVLAIDQGEELLAPGSAASSDEAARLAQLVDRAVASGPELLVLIAARSDSLPRFEKSPEFQPLFDKRMQPFNLPRLSPGNFSQIIEGPAAVLRDRPLRIEPALTQKLLADTENQPDALPLLAFTLQRLHERFGSDGDLQLEEYERFGGLLGALRAAEAEIRAEALERGLARDDREVEDKLRRVFVPHLVAVDEQAEVVRRVARLDDLPEDVLPLVEILVDRHHLLRIDMRGDRKVVEVAHEALLREWSLVAGFVEDVRVELGRLRELSRAADTWSRRGRTGEYLDHKGERLLAAEALLVDDRLRALVEEHPSAREYIAACRKRDEDQAAERRAARERERGDAKKILQRTRLGLAAAVAGALVAGGLTFYAVGKAREARTESERARKAAQTARTQAFKAEIQGLRARSEQNFARANFNASLAAATRLRPPRPDTESYLERLEAGEREFRERAESLLEEAHRLELLPDSERTLDRLAETPEPPVLGERGAFDLEMIKARHGTSMLVSFGAPDERRTMLYGGGPPGVFRESLRPVLQSAAKRAGLDTMLLDLVIVPQQDVEYLKGIDDLFRTLSQELSEGLPPSVEVTGLWHNSFVRMEEPGSGVPPQDPLRDRLTLEARRLAVPVNRPFDYFIAAADTGPARVSLKGGLVIYVIGPTYSDIEGLHELWRDRVSDRLVGDAPAVESVESILDQIGGLVRGYSSPDVELIRSPRSALGPGGEDFSVVNRSSMVLLLDYAGWTVLLPGDANSGQIIEGLRASGHLRGSDPVDFDVVMLPHAGSDRNVNEEFFRLVRADHYLIFGNGLHTNPEPRTLQWLVEARAEDDRPYTLHLTHSLEELAESRSYQQDPEAFARLERVVNAALASGQLLELSSPAEGALSRTIRLGPASPDRNSPASP